MTRAFSIDRGALRDLREIWALVNANDGTERADKLTAKIEAFCFRLVDIPFIGTRHDERRAGLRSVGIRGLRTGTVLFVSNAESVTVLRIGYLGRNVWEGLPE
jgi:plasmid stabilization system protein ParE